MTMSRIQGSSAYSLPCVLPRDEGERRRHDQELPAPEVDLRQDVAEEARLQQPLHRVVGAREDDVPAEREDDRVRVQRPEPAEREERREVQPRHEEHGRDQDPHEHADHGPDHGGQEEEPRGSIVIADGVAHRSPILFRCVPEARESSRSRPCRPAGRREASRSGTGEAVRVTEGRGRPAADWQEPSVVPSGTEDMG